MESQVKIRKIRVSDARALLDYFNELVKLDTKRVERPKDARKITIKDEINWVKTRIEDEKNKEMFVLVGEVNGKIIVEGEIERKKRWIERHVAEIRFAVLPKFEDVAHELIRQLLTTTKRNKLEILMYFHLSTQKSGLNIMSKHGFKRLGVIKRYYKSGNKYTNRIYLIKYI